jgi:Flp pilus assembly protein TadD
MEAPGAGIGVATDAEGAEPRALRRLAPVLLVAAVLVVFGRSLGHPFLDWDDPTAVTENPLLHPASAEHLAQIWRAPWSGLYVPASFTAWWLEMRVSGLLTGSAAPDPRVFHAGLLVLHAGCVLLVLRILRRLVRSDLAAFVGALIYAVHPLQVESVAWITETRGVLATLFGLGALDLFLAGAERPEGPSILRHHLPSTLLLVLALLSKPTAAAIPLVAFLLERFRMRRPLARSLSILGAWVLVVAGDVLLTRAQQGGASIHFTTPALERPFVALDALAFYLRKLVWPAGLAADYGRTPAWLLAQPGFRWHAGLPLAATAGLALLPGRRTWLLAAAIFAAALSPVLGLVPFDFQAISTVADRYVHLAMLAPALAIAALVARFPRPAAIAGVGVLAPLLGVLSWIEVASWRDTETLFRRTLEVNPRSHVACVHLGVAAERRGHREEAAGWYRKALELEPGYPIAGGNLGRMLFADGRLDDAIALLRDTVQRNPDYPYAAQDLAIALAARARAAAEPARKRDFDESESVLRAILARQPGFPGAHLTLGQVLFTTGRAREAVGEFAAVLELAGDSADAHQGLALCYQKLGDRERAEQERRAALRSRKPE